MAQSVLARIPVVAGLAYSERVRQIPSSFVATLAVEADNRYYPFAIAVLATTGKVGYLPPEIARGYHAGVAAAEAPLTCPGRRALPSDHETSGVELLLDFTDLPVHAL